MLTFDLSLWATQIQAVAVDSNLVRQFQLLAQLVDSIFVIYGICVGSMILNDSPRGKESAQEFLILRLVGYVTVPVIAIAWGCSINEDVGKKVAGVGCIAMAQAILFSCIWLTYFAKSRRVQATYADGLT